MDLSTLTCIQIFVSDFVVFQFTSMLPEELLKNWYHQSFSEIPRRRVYRPDSYFHSYAQLSKDEAIDIATSLWNEINLLNLKENILPTRERASLIMTKSANHSVNQVRLRK